MTTECNVQVKIKKGSKYFEIYQREFYDPLRRYGYFIATEEGEGMELDEADFYDHIKKYFEDKM